MNYIEKILEEINNDCIKTDMWDNIFVDTELLGQVIAKHIIYSNLDTNIVLDVQEYLNNDIKKEMNLIDIDE